MAKRILLTAFMSAAVIATMSACQTSDTQPAPSTVTVTQSPSATTARATSAAPTSTSAPAPSTSAAPTEAALTRQACELLTPELAKQYAGPDAQRRFTYDATPPVPVDDNACYFTGATREVEVSIYPRPTDPTAPVNHFHVIAPQNRVDGVDFEAYWFGPAESIVAVKDGMLIGVKVAQLDGARPDQDLADNVELAKLVVGRFG